MGGLSSARGLDTPLWMEATVMIVLYIGFGVWMASEAVGLTNALTLR